MNSYILWRLDPSLRPDRPTPRADRQRKDLEALLRRSKAEAAGAADVSREPAA